MTNESFFNQWNSADSLCDLPYHYIGYEVLIRRKTNPCCTDANYSTGFIEFDDDQAYIVEADENIIEGDFVWKLLEEDF